MGQLLIRKLNNDSKEMIAAIQCAAAGKIIGKFLLTRC